MKDNQGRTPIEIAIKNTHIEGEESISAILLRNGANLSEQLWHQLLIYSLDKDLVTYPKIAFERGVYLHNVEDDSKFSFHNAVW